MRSIPDMLAGDLDGPRPTLLTFNLPYFGKYAVLGSPASFWIQIFMMLAIQSIISAVFAVFIYYFIVKKRGSSSVYLLGYGVVFPLVMMTPATVVPILGISSNSVLVGISALCVIVPFHCMEAMYETSHPTVEKSVASYMAYYCSVTPFRRDAKTGLAIPFTNQELLRRFRGLMMTVLLEVVVTSYLLPYNFAPFQSPRNGASFIPLSTILHWGHILNNLAAASYTSLSVDFGSEAIAIGVAIVTGRSTISIMDSPMTKSQSVSDFWGRRWNLMIHDSLKRAVYKPLRRSSFPSWVAAGSAFVVSGLLHEFVLTIIALKAKLYPGLGKDYTPRWGNHMIFFLWNGLLIVLEYWFRDHPIIQWISKHLPRPVVTCLILMTVLPMSHLFTDEYINSGFYDDFAIGCPTIVKL